MALDSFSKKPLAKEEIGEAILQIALFDLMDVAEERTRKDICQDCLDRRCEAGKICQEYLRRLESYAWEIAGEKAELN